MLKNNDFLNYIDQIIVDKRPIIAMVRSVNKNISEAHNELLVIDDFTGCYNWYDYDINDETDTIVAYMPLYSIGWNYI